ncbi:MAG TPA: serine/threonine-protein kinase [Polyangiaceae bacterium]
MTAAASESGSPLAPGYKLDRYELLCPIAEGGMASVWVARQRGKHGFEKLVAIKTILPKFAADPRFHEMFLDEARIASRIEHLNVAQIFDLGEEHDVLYMAMEYVDGEALSKLNRACQKRQVKIPTGVVLRVLADACSGLHEAHELRDGGRPLDIVHRDVSPHNVLVTSRGIAKLIDFGIAKARSRVGNDTNSGVLKGKIQYMAPEQALGRPVDRRADVWAVGAILYHLLAGKPAYEGDNQLATLHLLGSGRPPVPLPDAVHPSIRAVVRKALAHAPENRYQTANELRDAIEDAMIEAMVPTNTSDVAAFSAQHLAERAEKRRASIELALSAAAERERVAALLKPAADRPSSGMLGTVGTPSGVVNAPPLSSARLPADSTAAEAPASKAVPEPAAKLTPRVSTPPPNAESYGTLGSAALDGSELIQQPRSRKGLVMVGALITVAALVATGVSFTMFRPKPETSAATMPEAPPAPSPTVSASAAPSASASASAAPSASAKPAASASGGGIPTFSASSLPAAHPPPQPPPRWVPSPPAPAPPAPPPKPKPKTVDDGF